MTPMYLLYLLMGRLSSRLMFSKAAYMLAVLAPKDGGWDLMLEPTEPLPQLPNNWLEPKGSSIRG